MEEIIFEDFVAVKGSIEPPFNYTGSKYKMLGQLLPYFDYTKDNFVDLFAGGGSVYANVVDRYKTIYANDIIKDLIEIHRELIFNLDETIEMVKKTVVSKDDKEGYLRLRESYNEDNSSTASIKLYALMLCCTNNMMRFNKSFKFNQTFGKRTYNANTEKKILGFSNALQPHREKLRFSSMDFKEFYIPDNSFTYIDPPYSNTLAGYNAYWGKDDDIRLFTLCQHLHSRGITFAVSGVEVEEYEDCRLLRLLEKEDYIRVREIKFDYNKVSRAGKKNFREVLLVNYD